MAIWHLRAQIIGRSKGKSAVGAAAYRSGSSLHSEYTDLTFDYSKKRGIAHSEIMTPECAPDWSKNREELWNAVERCEKRKDATLAREIEVALPTELSLSQNKELIREYIKDQFISLGMVADLSIHDVDEKNPHAHIMLTMRPISEKGFGQKERSWNDIKVFEQWREQWAVITNKHLALSGIDKKIDHRSYVEQGIDLEPTIHRGITEQKKDEDLERTQKNKAIKERNFHRLLKDPQIALDLLTHHESVFSHEDLAKFVNSRTQSIEEFTKLKLVLETHKSMVDLGVGLDGKNYYTSKQVLERERDLLQTCEKLSKLKHHQLNPEKLSYVLRDRNLTEEQLRAFNYILSGNDLSLVVGFAGTGKSYLLDAVREAYEAEGYRVVGTALSGRASDGLMQSAGIESRTIARNLIDWENDRYKLDNKTVLVIDEIGMVGTRQMQLLIQEAKKAGAKVVGCGDPEQIPPVEAGCPFRVMLEKQEHVTLENVIRQKIDWQRQATVELSTRQHSKALNRYYAHGHIHEHQTRQDAMNAIVESWNNYKTQNPQKSIVMMAYRNLDVLELNLKARDKLIEQDRINTNNSVTIDTEKFGELNIGVNDRIMFLKNDNDIDVRNGNMGQVVAVNEDNLTVKMDRGDTLAFSPQKYNHLGYGYASTVHKLQGETIDKALVLATPHFDRFITNVSLDRHRDDVELHYGRDDFKSYQNLNRTLSRGESKILAIEFAQARGIDYDLSKDVGAQVESKTDFKTYWKDILAECEPIKNTLAEKYLQNVGLNEMDCKSLKFHPAVWNKEAQTYMPGLIAQAVGFDENRKTIPKGFQVTYLDADTKLKAKLESPVRFAGEVDSSIIMVQKPNQPDNRWFVTMDIESALSIAKSNPKIRVACITTLENFEKNPLQGSENNLTLCLDKNTPENVIEKAKDVFSEKNFNVFIAKPENELNFSQLLLKEGKEAVNSTLEKAQLHAHPKLKHSEVELVIKKFDELDKNLEKSNQQPYLAHQVIARECIDKYALEIGRNKLLLQKINQNAPELGKRIQHMIEQEHIAEL